MSEISAAFCDGGCIAGNPSTIGITWAWCLVDIAGERIAGASGMIGIDQAPGTNNVAELIAACKALAALPPGWQGEFCSDSKITLGRIFWGFACNGIPQSWVERMQQLRARLGPDIKPVLLQGHPSTRELASGIGERHGFRVSPHNIWCDEACTRAGKEYLANQRREI